MKKSVIAAAPAKTGTDVQDGWLDLERVASVEVTSEDPNYPVDSVFGSAAGPGWRAAEAGRQIIRLIFAEPQHVRRIHLEFSESEVARTQEFTLRWANSPQAEYREIVRQQWNFSPQGANSEVEDYRLDLAGVSLLELTVIPDVSGGGAKASLAQWRVG